MYEFADISRRLESLIRLGTIAQVDHAKGRVRVKSGGLVSHWLPWLTLRAGTTREWDPPTVDEQCVLLSPSGEPTTGIVLLGLFSSANPAPSTSPDDHVRIYPDGARISYNHATGALAATGIQTALLQASTHVTVDCPHSTFTGDVTINGDLTVDGQTLLKSLLTYLAGMAGSGGGSGSTTISGNLTHSGGSLSSNGITLHSHTHSGVQTGPGNTGGPQ